METTEVLLYVLQWSLVAIGVAGNVWVIRAILYYNVIKKASNKIMFINLAVTDLGVLIVRNPFFFLHHYYEEKWFFGDFACRVLMPVSLTFMPASFLTLLAISFSRYTAIVYVKQLKELPVRITKYIVAFIWAFVIVFYPLIEIPNRFVNKTASECQLDIPTAVSNALYLFEDFYFVFTFLAITYMFVRIRRALLKFSKIYNDAATMEHLAKNRHALNLLWPVVVALFVTVTPLLAVRLCHWIWQLADSDRQMPRIVGHVVDILLVTNSAINPFLYIIVSTEFRQKLLHMHDCCRLVRIIFSQPERWGRTAPHKTRQNRMKESCV